MSDSSLGSVGSPKIDLNKNNSKSNGVSFLKVADKIGANVLESSDKEVGKKLDKDITFKAITNLFMDATGQLGVKGNVDSQI